MAESLLFWAGSASIVLCVALMALCALRDLGWLPAPLPRPRAPGAHAAPLAAREAVFWFLAALASQWAVVLAAYCIVHGGWAGLGEGLWQRFTTAGDSPHYLYLAQNGYQRSGEQSNLIVFYPLYPLLLRLLGALAGGRYALCGMVLSQLCFGGAAVCLRALAGRRLPAGGARCAAAALLLYPFAFFAFGVYTEGLFLLLSLAALYLLETRRWGAAGVAAALAALCRTQGLALLFAALFAVLAAPRRERRGGWAAVLGAPAGYGAYLCLNWAVQGDFFRYLYHQSVAPWYQHAQWFGANLVQQFGMAQDYPGLARFIYIPQLVLYFVGLAALAFLLWRGTAPAAGIYALAYFGMSYLSSWLISGGRYLFGCVGLFLALGSVRRPALRAALLAGEGALFLLYAVYYMQGQAIM